MRTYANTNRRSGPAGPRGRRSRAAAWCAVFFALAGLAIAGCGGKGYATAPVSGTVTVDGKATPGIAVSFQPITSDKNKEPGPGSAGLTDATGRYKLEIIAPTGKKPGAVVGKHRVTLVTGSAERAPDDDTARPAPKPVVPLRELGKTREFDVPAGGTDKADFALSSK